MNLGRVAFSPSRQRRLLASGSAATPPPCRGAGPAPGLSRRLLSVCPLPPRRPAVSRGIQPARSVRPRAAGGKPAPDSHAPCACRLAALKRTGASGPPVRGRKRRARPRHARSRWAGKATKTQNRSQLDGPHSVPGALSLASCPVGKKPPTGQAG